MTVSSGQIYMMNMEATITYGQMDVPNWSIENVTLILSTLNKIDWNIHYRKLTVSTTQTLLKTFFTCYIENLLNFSIPLSHISM